MSKHTEGKWYYDECGWIKSKPTSAANPDSTGIRTDFKPAMPISIDSVPGKERING